MLAVARTMILLLAQQPEQRLQLCKITVYPATIANNKQRAGHHEDDRPVCFYLKPDYPRSGAASGGAGGT